MVGDCAAWCARGTEKPRSADRSARGVVAGTGAGGDALPVGVARAAKPVHQTADANAGCVHGPADRCRSAPLSIGSLDADISLLPADRAAAVDAPNPADRAKPHQPGSALQRAAALFLAPDAAIRLLPWQARRDRCIPGDGGDCAVDPGLYP